MSRFHKLRKANANDIFFIRTLEMDPANIFVHCWDEATHRGYLNDPRAHYLIAEGIQGTALGYAILFENEPGIVEWRRIIVARRDDGIGSAFMQAVIDRFTDEGASMIWLDVYEENKRARHVYSAMGFEEVRTEASASDPNVTLMIMERSLGLQANQ